ncbi:MAG: glycosyltransferase family 2 protein [Phycisphaerales bacterium]|nr:MAG: glycosyltransferase family 2 protein [Phycisphaerales bacterium]
MRAREDLTIVVCTHNRADMLRQMLISLSHSMAGSLDDAHVLVIDNASTDHTRHVVRQAASHVHLRCVTEPKLGLSAARNRALRESPEGAVWFLDDDVTVTPEWFPAARRALADHPEADWMGGRILPRWPRRVPSWMPTDPACPYKGMLVWYDQGPDDRVLTPDMPPFFGANLMFRTRVFHAARRFDEGLGPLGKRPRLGDDVSLQSGLLAEGRVGRYVPRAAVYHPAMPERLRLYYLLCWHCESGLATVRIARQSKVDGRWLGVPRYIYRQTLNNLFDGTGLLAAGLITAHPIRAARGLSLLALAGGKAAGIGLTAFDPPHAGQSDMNVTPEGSGLQPACAED